MFLRKVTLICYLKINYQKNTLKNFADVSSTKIIFNNFKFRSRYSKKCLNILGAVIPEKNIYKQNPKTVKGLFISANKKSQ